MRKTYIVGEAKSALNLKGAKDRSLELDARRLAETVREIREQGYNAVAYLMVLTEPVAQTARHWCRDTGIEVLVADLTATELKGVQDEKTRNARGLFSGNPADSSAKLAQEAAEEALTRAIEHRHPGVRASSELAPLRGRKWDFFGVVSEN
jgi:hypothetical protein